MKLILALFFSLQIITNNAFVEDIARIPVLIHHYQHHQQEETPGISFLDFIAMHYSASANDKDVDHHSLPLKHANDAGHIHLIPAFTIPESPLGFSIVPTEVEHFTFHTQFIPNHNLDAIFQPPKFC